MSENDSEFHSRIEKDTDYAISCLNDYERALDYFGMTLPGSNILELGPGHNFGHALILADRGAKVTLSDLYITGFGRPYHPAAYKALNDRFDGKYKQLDLAQSGYQDTSLVLLHEPAERLSSVANSSMDLVYSNAVLEHVYDVARTAQETARVMRDGGVASHQIDLRYHFHDFQRPLEHLLMTDDEFLAEASTCHWICGNRVRSLEFVAHFESCGLGVIEREANLLCEAEYFKDAVRRLREARSPYRLWPIDDLLRIGVRFFLRKETGRAANETMARGRDLLQMIDAMKRAALN